MAINILIVDDSSVMRSIIHKSLRMGGVQIGEVYQAGNGKEGIETLEDNWVDLIIADINMPVMNGEEMIAHIRENPDTSDIPIIVVSTEGSETRVDRLKEKGVSFIHKPFSPECMRDNVNEILGVVNEG